ncbi:MAG: AAA family ATPase [Bdellovibrionota bacterium]
MNARNTNRIFITGNAGSGKTTLAKLISARLKTPFYSLDSIVWQHGWQVTPLDERNQLISRLVKKDFWIIEGVSKAVLDSATTIIFLDMSRSLCFKRLILRNYKYLFKSRPELPENCPEIKIIRKLIPIVWNFNKLVRPIVLSHLEKNNSLKGVYHIKTTEDLAYLYKRFEL